jgi:hypothetical protein
MITLIGTSLVEDEFCNRHNGSWNGDMLLHYKRLSQSVQYELNVNVFGTFGLQFHEAIKETIELALMRYINEIT